jgi:hypothetical protein
MRAPGRGVVSLLLAGLAVAACGGRSRTPPCGLGTAAAPTVILQRLDAGYALSEVPRGLPDRLPARVIGERQGEVLVAHEGNRLALGYQGAGFPTDTTYAFGLLVVDDSTQRVVGVLLYGSSTVPRQRPVLGSVTGGSQSLALYGVRVDWVELNNPRCPLLGDGGAASPR